MSLAGKHALVTGGGTGIGAAIALALAEAGTTVTICGRRRQPLETTAAGHNNIAVETADVTNEESIGQLYARARAVRGDFDIVVANAGSARSAPAEKITRELWMSTLHTNLTGAFLSVQPAIAGMRQRGWGRMIFVASSAGLRGYPYVAPYVAAKHGVVGLARALAAETANDGITANAVCPGYTETPLLTQAIARIVANTKRSEAEVRATLAADNSDGRLVQPQEVANVVLRLCADESASITGQAIPVPGDERW
ncbi:MAG TPA: SDR family NAD(P)-dependent oxidoreductase [Xanthobacteraceae bacterium]|nr:SDR family NAD(P)-dependent oxidoreductase [Xanthobacteraceae bacterium]